MVRLHDDPIYKRIKDLADPEKTKSGNEAEELIKMIEDDRAMRREAYHREVSILQEQLTRLSALLNAFGDYLLLKQK